MVRRFAERMRAVGTRRAAMLLAAAVLATALSASACTGERTEAGTVAAQAQQNDGEEVATEPLTLTLSAPEICETTQARGYSGSRQWQDEDGNWVVESYSTGFDDVGETAVTWSAGGGVPPYTLVIDGETRDAEQAYAGPGGTASVSCAMQIGETFIDDNGEGRRYRTEPEVDSGLKTIRATVTDAAGATAEAAVDVYVILQIGDGDEILEPGKTYRVHRFLVTVPDGLTLLIGDTEQSTTGTAVSLYTPGPRYRTWIWIDPVTGEAGGRYFRHGYGHVKTDGTLFQTYEEAEAGLEPKRIEVPDEVRRVDALFDELVESINRVPAIDSVD